MNVPRLHLATALLLTLTLATSVAAAPEVAPLDLPAPGDPSSETLVVQNLRLLVDLAEGWGFQEVEEGVRFIAPSHEDAAGVMVTPAYAILVEREETFADAFFRDVEETMVGEGITLVGRYLAEVNGVAAPFVELSVVIDETTTIHQLVGQIDLGAAERLEVLAMAREESWAKARPALLQLIGSLRPLPSAEEIAFGELEGDSP